MRAILSKSSCGLVQSLKGFKNEQKTERLTHLSNWVFAVFQDGTSAIFLAARCGYAGVLSMLLQSFEVRADFKSLARHDGITPLMMAAAMNHEACVDILLSSGFDPNEESKVGSIFNSWVSERLWLASLPSAADSQSWSGHVARELLRRYEGASEPSSQLTNDLWAPISSLSWVLSLERAQNQLTLKRAIQNKYQFFLWMMRDLFSTFRLDRLLCSMRVSGVM